MGEIIQLRPRPLRPIPDLALRAIDSALSAVEEEIDRRSGWLPKLLGPWRQIALSEIAELESKKRRLEQQRLRVSGAELCVKKGGKS